LASGKRRKGGKKEGDGSGMYGRKAGTRNAGGKERREG